MLVDALVVLLALAAVAATGVGGVRAAMQGHLLSSIGAFAAGIIVSVAISAVAHQLITLALASQPDAKGLVVLPALLQPVGEAIALSPFLYSVLLSASQPSMGSMALMGMLLLLAHYARTAARLATDAEILFKHWALFGHAAMKQD